MAHNAAQSGAYTPPGSDGTLEAGTLAFDTTYTFHGDGNGELYISLAGGSASGDGGAIECRVTDDGEFTIPADMIEASQLGDMAFLNMLTIDRRGTGTAIGDDLAFHAINVIQTSLINVIKAQ